MPKLRMLNEPTSVELKLEVNDGDVEIHALVGEGDDQKDIMLAFFDKHGVLQRMWMAVAEQELLKNHLRFTEDNMIEVAG